MRRRSLLLPFLLLTACGGPAAPPTYPKTLEGGYRLVGEQVLPGNPVPDLVPAAGLVRVMSLVYQSANSVQLLVFETTGSSVAFEAMQKWRTQDGKRAVHRERYFVVAQSGDGNAATLDAFLTEFEKHLK